MSQRSHRFFRPESLTALGIIAVAAIFLLPATSMRPISALLPVAMLVGLIGLAVILLIADQRAASRGEAPKRVTEAPLRALSAFALIVAYAIFTDIVGFYIATAIVVPLGAFLFGYRSPVGLLIATVIVMGSAYLIFDFAMSQEFPSGLLWDN